MKARLTRTTNIVVIAIAGMLAAVGIAYAAIPGGDGVITVATTPSPIRRERSE
jgi:hypothetical protein